MYIKLSELDNCGLRLCTRAVSSHPTAHTHTLWNPAMPYDLGFVLRMTQTFTPTDIYGTTPRTTTSSHRHNKNAFIRLFFNNRTILDGLKIITSDPHHLPVGKLFCFLFVIILHFELDLHNWLVQIRGILFL